jgi:hypothetical protein
VSESKKVCIAPHSYCGHQRPDCVLVDEEKKTGSVTASDLAAAMKYHGENRQSLMPRDSKLEIEAFLAGVAYARTEPTSKEVEAKTGSLTEFCSDDNHEARTCNACWAADHPPSKMETTFPTLLDAWFGERFGIWENDCTVTMNEADFDDLGGRIAEALRTVERETLERAAQIAEDWFHDHGKPEIDFGALAAAVAIRAQKSSENGDTPT